MSSSSEFNIDPSTRMEADLPKNSVLTVVAHSGDLYNYQPGTQELLNLNNASMEDFLNTYGITTNVHTKLYKVCKARVYHIQNILLVHKYTTTTSILDPHNIS